MCSATGSAHKHQEKLRILGSQVEKLILARRQLFENERKREMSIYAELAEAEEKRLVIIEEERKRFSHSYRKKKKESERSAGHAKNNLTKYPPARC